MKLGNERLLNLATGVLTLCAVVVTALRVRQELRSDEARPTRAASPVANWRDYALQGARMGPAEAKVTIVEFSDFQCPFCRKAAPDLKALRHRYEREVAVVYRHLPSDGHRFALKAAIASECAERLGAFEPYHDLLFAQGDSIGMTPWTVLASQVGISDTARFARCMSDRSITAVVNRDKASAATLGIDATPTFLINNLKLVGYSSREELEGYVRTALKHR